MGDFWQLPVVDKDVRCERSPAWVYHVKTLPFHEQVRCKCPTAAEAEHPYALQCQARSSSTASCGGIGRGKATARDGYDLLETFRKHPRTTVVTCTRAASAHINHPGRPRSSFQDRHKRPLGKAALSYEANQDNFTETGKLKDGRLAGGPDDQSTRACASSSQRTFPRKTS